MTLIAVSRLATIRHPFFAPLRHHLKRPPFHYIFVSCAVSTRGDNFDVPIHYLSTCSWHSSFLFLPFQKRVSFHLFIGRFSSKMTPFSSLSRRTNKHNEDIESSLFSFLLCCNERDGCGSLCLKVLTDILGSCAMRPDFRRDSGRG